MCHEFVILLPISQGWLSGQKHLTVNQAGYALQRFESSPLQVSFTIGRAPAHKVSDSRSEKSKSSGPHDLSTRNLAEESTAPLSPTSLGSLADRLKWNCVAASFTPK